MAEAEVKPRLDGIETLIEIIIVLLLVAAVLNRIPILIQEKTGIDIFNLKGSYERLTSVNENTPLGSVISMREGAEVLAAPLTGRILGFQDKGVRGILEGGPEDTSDGRWWFVDFEDDPDGWVSERLLMNEAISRTTSIVKAIFYFFSTLLIAGFLGLVLYLGVRINQVRAREARAMKAAVASALATKNASGPGKNPRWLHVLESIESEKPNDWRQAIIEADIMLDELVTRMGYRGANLGERLKQIEKSDFTTLELAWEAHKVRNQIAHAGSNYVLTQRDARQTVDLYRQVFEEFFYI